MGFQLRRVALDFAHPVGEVWSGYVNSCGVERPACGGEGATMAYERLSSLVSLLMRSGSDANWGTKPHSYFKSHLFRRSQGAVCGKEMVDLTTALAGKPPSIFGYDGCDERAAIKTILRAANMPAGWGLCAECDGEGITRESHIAYNAWTRTEPPAGDGYQMWETVSDGSPITPVYGTPEQLAEYLARFHSGSTYEGWLAFINGPGREPSAIMDVAL